VFNSIIEEKLIIPYVFDKNFKDIKDKQIPSSIQICKSTEKSKHTIKFSKLPSTKYTCK